MDSYKDSGVDIDAGNRAEALVAQAVKGTYNAQVVSGVGGFGAVYSLAKVRKMKNPLLVSTVDGVGTKLKVAAAMGRFGGVGADIVNHCSNDILAMGAEPLFFLDYIASSRISPEKVAEIVSGMAGACRELGCALVGGETAEMPGIYVEGETDVVGCMVGVVDSRRMIDGSKVRAGDSIIALASSGLHTNGYSLARKVLFDKAGYRATDSLEELGGSIGDALLAVHRSYSKNVLALSRKVALKGIAHITGGGLPENVPRILPSGLQASYDYSSIEVPEIFRLIRRVGGISNEEMFRVFNMGVGLVLIVSRKDAGRAVKFLNARGEKAWPLGEVRRKG